MRAALAFERFAPSILFSSGCSTAPCVIDLLMDALAQLETEVEFASYECRPRWGIART